MDEDLPKTKMQTEPPKDDEIILPGNQPGNMGTKVNLLSFVTYTILIVLVLGFAACFIASTAVLIDAWKGDKASQEDLRDQVLILNAKIDTLTKSQNDLKSNSEIESLQKQVSDLKEKNYLR